MDDSTIKCDTATLSIPHIKNGSRITIGDHYGVVNVFTDKHFNWFQKKMIKWCFGFKVEDYSA